MYTYFAHKFKYMYDLMINCDLICIVDLLQKQWTPGRTQKPHPRVFTMREDSKAFADHFDQVQEQLEKLNIFLFTLGALHLTN